MSGTQALASAIAVTTRRRWPTNGGGRLRGADLGWAVAFVIPYLAVFLAFVVYPYGYALWMASSPALYRDLVADGQYLPTLLNTLVFVGLGVNLKMFLALLLSGFFLRRRWWTNGLLAVYLLPWTLAAAQAYVSVHWMLIGQQGLVDGLLAVLFGIEGPIWFNTRWLAMAANIAAYLWKWMPFWTVIFVAARMMIPRELYDAAAVDGATGVRRFIHVTFPLMTNLYVICTLLSALWMIGDFTTVYLVSGGGPGGSTEVLATLGFNYAFERMEPALGVAAVMSVLPVLLVIVIVMIRRLHAAEAQL